ncbi:unnamed protein product [Mytilus edulis]|uniref:Uncharacterized protein n=1 Tax=Mytilus edulis TaxID=6550 RepID=A0A8S3R3G8_MYTED|nr:unnamed protein product [Mytilus edulis]
MASRNLNMRGTRDRTKEFLEKVTEEQGDITYERKTRKNPLEKLSKEKRKLHKLEKRKRETNKETEVFLDSVNDIKKNIENLKMKVEEIKGKDNIENWVTSTEKAPSSTESVKVVANGIDHSKKGKCKKSKKSETFTEDKQTDEPEDDLNGNSFKRDKTRWSDRFFKRKKSKTKLEQEESLQNGTEKSPSLILENGNGVDSENNLIYKRENSENSSISEDKEDVDKNDGESTFKREKSRFSDRFKLKDSEIDTLKRDKSRFSGRFYKRKISETNSNEEEEEVEEDIDLAFQRYSQVDDKQSIDSENANEGSTLKRDKTRFSGIFKRLKSKTKSNEDDIQQISEEGNKSVSNENSDFGDKVVSQISEEEITLMKPRYLSKGIQKVSFRKERSPQKSIEESETSFIASENKIKNSDMLDEEMEPMISRNNHKSESSGSGNTILDLTPKNSSQPLEHERLIELQSSPLQETSEDHEQEEESPLIAKYNEVNVDSKSRQIITLGPEKTMDSNGASNLRNGETFVINIEGNKSEVETGPIIRRKSDQSFTDSEKSIESSAEVSSIDESNGREVNLDSMAYFVPKDLNLKQYLNWMSHSKN